MKKFLLTILVVSSIFPAFGNHITGGEMSYTYNGRNGNNYTYTITLRLYRDCFSTGAQLDPNASISIFTTQGNQSVWNQLVPRNSIQILSLGTPDPCISNPPQVCYEVGIYSTTVTLPGNPAGYTISYQRCCRIAGINNLFNSSSVGATYTAIIPGTGAIVTPEAPENNSARFIGEDTVIVCANNAFGYNFGAVDADGDSLTYSFCNAYVGGSTGNAAPNPPSPPPYSTVPYAPPFNAFEPLGPGVSLNPATGFISGVAPNEGIYVVTVCVNEFRDGQLIATQRKDLQIKVAGCNVAAADLDPEYITCDGFTMSFFNNSTSDLITSYYWTFGDPSTGTNDTSLLATPSHTYSDTGIFIVTLITNRGDECSDTATAIVKVYPGFFPGFTFAGICMNVPTQFTDTTKTAYGVVDTWSWDFGDLSTGTDVSNLQNPAYTYTQTGVKTVRFIVTNSKGCIDTVFKDITIIDKPPLSVSFEDTLICRGDVVQLEATGTGDFSWTPLTNITNPNTATPTVNPTATTDYIVSLNQGGCINKDTVRVRVVNFVTLAARSDTTICEGDTVRLNANTDGLNFSWSPTTGLDDPTILNPMATPPTTTTYTITARIGGCTAQDDVVITVAPYPIADAGEDAEICFDGNTQLNGSVNGASFTWTPAFSLSDPNVLNPVAFPKVTTSYILSTVGNQGCPKPGKDTVIVTVRPRVIASAGSDTSVVVGQPLIFNATGGTNYLWDPPTELSDVNIPNPIAIYDGTIDSIRYQVIVTDDAGCADTATILVRIFKTNPQIFVPSAFTPNGDGKNDLFRPIAVGIKKFEYFRVYNRWGQLVFSTSINGHGWDGNIGGRPQGTNVFVWIVQGIDYLDQPFFKKGTVTLVR